jgi:hypothetical protein
MLDFARNHMTGCVPGTAMVPAVTELNLTRREKHARRAGGVGQGVECLPSKCEALEFRPQR